MPRRDETAPHPEYLPVRGGRLCRHALRAGTLPASAFETVFRRATVYAERPPNPGLMVVDVSERGRWAPVFSSLDRLAAHAGECDYQAMSGADLLELLPPATGVILDPRDEHRGPAGWAAAGGLTHGNR